MATRNNPSAFLATHPGEVLAAELEERGITQKAFAEEIGMRPSHLSELINGKRNVTMAIADKLQEALGIEAQSWMNLQVLFV
ncbi:MAG: HigA family addiction module antidote protein [Prevotellaceae bacterium]|nr:HigA family addiction module antidote protein [Candidatus Minthosoma caballi]